MPVIGYFAGSAATSLIKSIDHWVAFGLLAIIGINMIRESFDDEGCERTAADIGVRAMLPLAVATSIDAAAVGVSFAFLNVKKILPAALIVGSVTFIASIVAVSVGRKMLGQIETIVNPYRRHSAYRYWAENTDRRADSLIAGTLTIKRALKIVWAALLRLRYCCA